MMTFSDQASSSGIVYEIIFTKHTFDRYITFTIFHPLFSFLGEFA